MGGIPIFNKEQYTNDCFMIYTKFVRKAKYKSVNIFVLETWDAN